MFLNLKIDTERLLDEIDKLATFSDAPAPAVTRIIYSPSDIAARAWLRGLLREAKLSIYEDAIGNLFARWDGNEPDLPAVATGSHIDAIPFSGKFDGVVGVLGALEAIRALQTAGFEPKRSIELILFTAEEPTRFGIGCLGSRAMAGQLDAASLESFRDRDGATINDLRYAAGFHGNLQRIKLDRERYSGFVELHIEQGPRLEAAKKGIGIVTSIAAPATLRVTLKGDGGHAGAVLMPRRKDALTAASEIVLAVEETARKSSSDDSVATVGLLNVYPGAVNSIPSQIQMEIDIRDTQLAPRDAMVAEIKKQIETVSLRRGIRFEIEILNSDPPCQSDERLVSAIVSAARRHQFDYEKLVSRAYHDTLFMAQLYPTAMIFIPSKNGYSHRPEEYSSPEEIEKGVAVLASTLASLSQS
ncbi:MAG: M20 family metallo-hydrolase [Chloroflexota bacterium]